MHEKQCSVNKSAPEKQAWKSDELNSLLFWFKESTILQEYKHRKCSTCIPAAQINIWIAGNSRF